MVAADAGARVVERFDSKRKSKGYAIEFLMDKLIQSGEFDRLDALVMIDADTTIDPGLLRSFDQALREGRDWIQCYYTVANPDESWRTRLMTYAFSLFNGVFQLGQNALGISAGLRGNGMCFSIRGLRRVPWKAYGLVEDMEYSWTLRTAGEWIAFEPAVSVQGAMLGSGGRAAADQRRRWEFGRSEVRRKWLGRLLRCDRLGWGERAVSICELLIPPLAVLLIAYLVMVVLDGLAFALPGLHHLTGLRWSLLSCAQLMTVALVVYAVSPFLVLRLPWRYFSSLVFLPFYVAWKLLISRGGAPREWVRTIRPAQNGQPGAEAPKDHGLSASRT
jgi:hypothetical protein